MPPAYLRNSHFRNAHLPFPKPLRHRLALGTMVTVTLRIFSTSGNKICEKATVTTTELTTAGEGAGGGAAAGELTRRATVRAPLLGWRRRTEGLTALRESFIPVPGTAAAHPVVRNLFGPPGILSRMLDVHTSDRLAMVSKRARDAEARGDDALAGEEWRRYRLVRDAGRDPDELLAEGIALSVQAAELAGR